MAKVTYGTMDIPTGEILTAIDFESYTADNTRPYDHMQFTSGSEGMFIRLRDDAAKTAKTFDPGNPPLTNSIELKKLARCGLLQGVFQTCSNNEGERKYLESKSRFLNVHADVFPQKVYEELDSSGNLICTWQMAKSGMTRN